MESREVLSPSFEERRARIAALMDTGVVNATSSASTSSAQLSARVKEFYDVHRHFHEDMAKLVMDIHALLPSMPEDKRETMIAFLAPYKRLAQNPFNSTPTGNLEKDLDHVISVVQQDNQKFRDTFAGLRDAIANIQDLKTELDRFEEDEKFKKHIRQVAGSCFKLDSQATAALQHLFKYELLLVAIKKELTEAEYEVSEQLVAKVLGAIEDVVPEVKRLNRYNDVMILFNRCERVLYDLASQEAEKIVASDGNDGQAKEMHDLIHAIKYEISCAKEDIAGGGKDIHKWLKNISDKMQALEKRMTTSSLIEYYQGYVTWARNYVVSTVQSTLFGEGAAVAQTNDDVKARLSGVNKLLENAVNAYEKVKPVVKPLQIW